MANPEKAYMADCPTIGDIYTIYSPDHAVMWIWGQVLAVYGMSSSKDPGQASVIKHFSENFAASVKQFKLTELMLFFAEYKAGLVGKGMQTFDARKIGNAFFLEFLPKRNQELDRYERAKVQEEIEARRFTPPEGFSSLSWYNHLKKRASEGDQEAINLLRNGK